MEYQNEKEPSSLQFSWEMDFVTDIFLDIFEKLFLKLLTYERLYMCTAIASVDALSYRQISTLSKLTSS